MPTKKLTENQLLTSKRRLDAFKRATTTTQKKQSLSAQVNLLNSEQKQQLDIALALTCRSSIFDVPQYSPALPVYIETLMKQGLTLKECAANLLVSENLLHFWKKTFPELSTSCENGRTYQEAYWLALGRRLASGEQTGNAAIYMFLMKNLFNYKDKEHPTNQTNIQINQQVSEEQAKKIAASYLNKEKEKIEANQ